MASLEKLLSEKAEKAEKAKAKQKPKPKRPRATKDPDKIHCIYHGGGLVYANYYMASKSSIFRNTEHGKIPICKSCLEQMFINYFLESKDLRWSMYKVCQKIDVPFMVTIFDGAIKTCEDTWQKTLGHYMRIYNSFATNNNWEYNFDNSDSFYETAEDISEEERVNEFATKLTKDEKEAKKAVIVALGDDPFESATIQDQKYLYKNLLEYFKDEDVLEDTYKVSQIIQLVSNNGLIRTCQSEISKLKTDPLKNLDDIKRLSTIVKDIVANNDKIAKENGISEKNKRSGNSGGNTLGHLMKAMRNLGFEEAEQDYYDMKKAYGMTQAELASLKNIKDQIIFDEQDVNDLIDYQRTLIKDLEKKVMDLEEEIRKLVRGDKDESK